MKVMVKVDLEDLISSMSGWEIDECERLIARRKERLIARRKEQLYSKTRAVSVDEFQAANYGKKIQAIIMYRARTGVNLREAKKIIERAIESREYAEHHLGEDK